MLLSLCCHLLISCPSGHRQGCNEAKPSATPAIAHLQEFRFASLRPITWQPYWLKGKPLHAKPPAQHWYRNVYATLVILSWTMKAFSYSLPDITLLSCRHERITPKWPFCFVSCWFLVFCVSINVYRMLSVFQHSVVTLQARDKAVLST